MNWEIIRLILTWVIALNTIGAFITVFREKRDIAATWAWLLVLTFLPVVGFLVYAFLGRKLSRRQLDKIRVQPNAELTAALKQQQDAMPEPAATDTHSESVTKNMVALFQEVDHAFVTQHNQPQLFVDGTALFADMQAVFEAAQHNIYIEFYTFYPDDLGQTILALLIKKAKAGVKVRVLYDAWGSMGTTSKFFKALREAGGEAEPFLGIHSNWLNFRLNFRDHRKIVTVDGWTGYIGGFNIGDQYVGRKPKFGNWRDTHLRIIGEGVLALQEQFVSDWNATVPDKKLDITQTYFPTDEQAVGDTMMQVVASGPDSDREAIKLGYLQLINSARERLYIQSPYFIPDDSVLTALKAAVYAGVDVRLMVPHMPDHAFVYRATQYYARLMAETGAKVYFYQDGFLHAKVVTIDDAISSVGSANMDFRSFKLNFEANAFIYDTKVARELRTIFENDIANSQAISVADFHNMSWWLRFKQAGSRLLAPIL